jgi:S-adenosyl-L-methionine hydrolase (adenosine-forming)
LGIITLTSDLGLRDHYVAAVKAAILTHAPQAQIVDISHQVRSFDLNAAAFLVRSVWQQFPIGTVHVIGINPEFNTTQTHLVVQYMGHYFIAADNGVFSLILDEEPEDIYEINLPQGNDWTFPMKGVFATAAAHIAKGGAPEFLGNRVDRIQHVFAVEPSIEDALIKGRVEYIDHYGNVYTNISKSLFETVVKRRSFAIQFKKNGFAITRISNYYSDVLEGERLAMWASNGLLMIAIHGGASDHGGGAAELFGFQIDDIIRIEIHGDENREDDFQE